MKKIIFGVYGDDINAQNINGVEIAKRLVDDFECHMFYYNKKPNISGIHFHRTYKNFILKNIKKLIIYIFYGFDLYYMPRVEKTDVLFAKFFGRKKCIVSSIEIENAIHNNKYKKYFCKYIFDFFAINKSLQESVLHNWNKAVDVLYLGFNKTNYQFEYKERIKRIAFVGTLYERKRPDYILDTAKRFKDIEFILIGDGELKNKLVDRIVVEKISNVKLLGKLNNNEVYKWLSSADLLLITSDIEGQPKVSLEAASLAVPTCYIKNNYSIDYIKNNITGFEAKNLNEIYDIIEMINNNPKLLLDVSHTVYEKTQKYNWDILIEEYRCYFNKIINKWHGDI